MKYLIVGLGNYGIEYARTRHNIGFDILDHLAEARGAAFASRRLGDVAEFRHRGRSFTLVKPTTYMNRSGRAVAYWLTQLKLDISRLLVVVDDFNISLGRIRIRENGSAGGHNGLESIEEHLGTREYARLRFGIGDDFSKGRQVDFVLGDWTEDELPLLRERIPVASEAALQFFLLGPGRAMTTFNS